MNYTVSRDQVSSGLRSAKSSKASADEIGVAAHWSSDAGCAVLSHLPQIWLMVRVCLDSAEAAPAITSAVLGQAVASLVECSAADLASWHEFGHGGQMEIGVVTMERLLGEVERLMARQAVSAGFDSLNWLNQWLETPCPGLGGEQPKAWLDTPERLGC